MLEKPDMVVESFLSAAVTLSVQNRWELGRGFRGEAAHARTSRRPWGPYDLQADYGQSGHQDL